MGSGDLDQPQDRLSGNRAAGLVVVQGPERDLQGFSQERTAIDAIQSDSNLPDSLGQPHLENMPLGFTQGLFHGWSPSLRGRDRGLRQEWANHEGTSLIFPEGSHKVSPPSRPQTVWKAYRQVAPRSSSPEVPGKHHFARLCTIAPSRLPSIDKCYVRPRSACGRESFPGNASEGDHGRASRGGARESTAPSAAG